MPAEKFALAKQQILAGPDTAAKRFLIAQIAKRTGCKAGQPEPDPKGVTEPIETLEKTPRRTDIEPPWEQG